MNKEILALLVNALFSHIKDAKSLLLYSLTILITTFIYIILVNESEIIDFSKNFSRNKIIEQAEAEREMEYPHVAKERASMLYAQSNSDAVFIAEYKPKFVNNYQDIIAWEGGVTVDPSEMINIVIDRTSEIYQRHMLGESTAYSFKDNSNWSADKFITSGREYSEIGIIYLYSCPIYDLNNSYSGYIGIGYTSTPYNTLEEKHKLEGYLEKICIPHARALGRKK